MRNILSAIAVLLITCSAASAGSFATVAPGAPMSFIQFNGNTQTRTDDRQPRPQRYVCVVQPAQSDNRSRPYVCRADAGRVGGTCRCGNVNGTGRLDLDD